MQLKAALLSAAVAAALLPAASAAAPQEPSAMLGLNALLDLVPGPHAAADLAAAAAAADPLPENSAKCYADTMAYVVGWKDGGKFMIDAFGKVPSALLETGLFAYGSYSECLRERANWTLPEPQYCLNTFVSAPGKYGSCLPKSCDEASLPKAWPLIIKTLTDLASPGLFEQLKEQAPWFLNVVPHCARPSEWGAGAVLTLTALCIIGATVIFATGLDYYRMEFAAKKHDEKGTDTERLLSAEGAHADGDKPQVATAVTVKSESAWKTDSKESPIAKAIGGFSLFRSLTRLMVAEGGSSHTGALNGIRAISMFWVLLAHVFFYSTLIGDDNIRDFPELGDRWPYQILLNAFLSVDTFFFLSGFLVCYGALMTLHRTKRFSFPTYIVARVLRILPTYALMLFVYWKLQGFFGQGPNWYTRQTNPNCEKYWWTNMLFINNFQPGDVNKECMGWTWYLAVDFQCYFVAPLIFLPLYHKPRVGEAILGLFIVITTTIAGLLTVFYDLPATTIVKSVSGNNYSTIMYVKPYTRFAPYGIGMLVAYLFVKLSGRLDPPVNNPSAVPADAADPKAAAHHAKPKLRELTPELLAGPFRLAAWYAVGGVLLLSSLLGTYSLHQAKNLALAAALQDKPMADPWPLASRFFYNAYGHLAWSMGLGMILWPILAGRARFLSWFLNNTIWGVFAKLTFVAYLVHEMIVDIYFNNLGAPWHYGDVLNFGVFLGALTAAYAIAAAVWLCFEGPMGGVVKILLEVVAGKGKRGSK